MLNSHIKGEITSCDPLFAHLHGYSSSEDVVGHYIKDLIPSIQLPAPGKKIPKVPLSLLQTIIALNE